MQTPNIYKESYQHCLQQSPSSRFQWSSSVWLKFSSWPSHYEQQWNHLYSDSWPHVRLTMMTRTSQTRCWCHVRRVTTADGGVGGNGPGTYIIVQCNAWHWTDKKSLEWLVCVSIRLFKISTMATAAFVWYLEFRSHTWQRRLRSMANNTGSSKRACASIYFRFNSLLGLCLR